MSLEKKSSGRTLKNFNMLALLWILPGPYACHAYTNIASNVLPLDSLTHDILNPNIIGNTNTKDKFLITKPTANYNDIRKATHHSKHKPKIQKKKKQPRRAKKRRATKKWTIMIYIAADNDLNLYAWRNIKQMEQIGSDQNLNIVIQISERGKYKVTQRYIVEKNHLQKINFGNKKLNSGSVNTLINFTGWAISTCPADNYGLILWNHGTGAKEPSSIKSLNPSEKFVLNPSTNMLELDRSINFFDFISDDQKTEQDLRGICIDETHHSYISNKQLDYALKTICDKHLNGQKFNLIGFDACFMSMIEIANIAKKYAHFMVGSQEVELGAGWNYQHVLKLFTQSPPDTLTLVKHIINSYQHITGGITSDYTLSAINLDKISILEDNIHLVSQLLIESLRLQKNNSVRNIIKMCRSRRFCESFDEPSYIDLHNLYSSILKNLQYFQFTSQLGDELRTHLKNALMTGLTLIEQAVVANCVGKNLSRAKGLSIYFPSTHLHSSYGSIPFAHNNWLQFLKKYASI